MTTVPITQPLGYKGEKLQARDAFDLFYLSEKGITKRDLTRLAKFMDLSLKEMADLLPITYRTVQRYAPQDRFNPHVSEQILQISQVAARGLEVFSEKELFVEWLRTPIQALGHEKPIDFLSSRFGCEIILTILGRIEHGVYS
jgi:putative toxin-antitoxin system antitoxin component (TIGR02293 family)